MPDSAPEFPHDVPRNDRILADLQDAVTRMHVLAQHPRVVVAKGHVYKAHARLSTAMAAGPVIQAFCADRLPDDVATALVGVLVFEEDGLHIDGVRVVARELGVR